ncbi:MAG: hypothetical protein CMP65_04305 [Flavobacteriales bacterium]|nr:hypothetical protein [Flavobacteriales bacterium]|tara:strand:- start:9890 stop:11059 length:1170 start_codon:yes stop_codon:yes gene_type:complete
MIKFYFLCFFWILFFGCKNIIPSDKENNIISNNSNNITVLEKTKKPYILNKKINIPKNHTLIIKNGVKIILKNNGCFINSGNLEIGNNNYSDSSFLHDFNSERLDTIFYHNIEVYSKKKSVFLYNKNPNNLIIKNVLFKNIIINSINSNFSFLNSSFLNSDIINNNSIIKINNSFFYNTIIKNKNVNFLFNESIFSGLKNNIINDSVYKSTINNCLFTDLRDNLIFDKCFDNNIINSVFINNSNSIIIEKGNRGYLKLHNNLFINNKVVLSIKDSCQFYLFNNSFIKNKNVLSSNLNKLTYKKIISKNNIFYNNNLNFKLKNILISNSYCISNTDSLKGYYNISSSPLFVNEIEYNYNLSKNSPGFRSGINNIDIGVNINNINIIKYLN